MCIRDREVHEPEKMRDLIVPWLESEGHTVTVSPSLDSYLDKKLMKKLDLVLQIYTMSEITEDQEKGLLKAVRDRGVSLAGWHGGLGDAFRKNVEYQFMVGGQWVSHPGGIIDYTVNIIGGAQYDVGVIDILSPISGLLTFDEGVSIEIYNYGESEVSNFEVSYQLDNGEIVTEVFTEVIPSGQSAVYSFNTLLDLSNMVGEVISISASTGLDNDEDSSNDMYTADLLSLYPADVGVSSMISPESGVLLSDSESVSISITNFGGEAQSNFEVTYLILETGVIVTEDVLGPIEPNSSIEFTFSQTADLSVPGVYTFECYTSLPNDSDPSNDAASVEIINSNCAPNINCSFNDGFQLFQLGDIFNESGCEEFSMISLTIDDPAISGLSLIHI